MSSESQRETISHQVEYCDIFCGPSPPLHLALPLLSQRVCASAFVSFIAKPHRIFKTHMLRLYVSHAHTHARAHTLGPVAEV